MKIVKNNLKEVLSLMSFFIILLIVFTFNNNDKKFTQEVEAGSEHNMSGYAWSDNIGWISFNCSDLSSCSTVDYGVNVESNNELSGYAWSENIGWVSFNESDLSGCPEGDCKAKLVGTSLEGWAKVLSDGGDWISLATQGGETLDYGVTINDSKFVGYAWGSDILGWIDFSKVILTGFDVPVITSFNVASVKNGGSPSINWVAENSDRCTGSWDLADVCSDEAGCLEGSDIGNPVGSVTSYTLTCYGTGGSVSEIKTPSSYYNLNFLDGYSARLDFNFVASGATTTITKIGVTPWNGFSSDVVLTVAIDSATPVALPVGSLPIYSDKTIDSSEYDTGSDISIYISEAVVNGSSIPVSGSGDILNGLDLIINLKKITPIFKEI